MSTLVDRPHAKQACLPCAALLCCNQLLYVKCDIFDHITSVLKWRNWQSLTCLSARRPMYIGDSGIFRDPLQSSGCPSSPLGANRFAKAPRIGQSTASKMEYFACMQVFSDFPLTFWWLYLVNCSFGQRLFSMSTLSVAEGKAV